MQFADDFVDSKVKVGSFKSLVADTLPLFPLHHFLLTQFPL